MKNKRGVRFGFFRSMSARRRQHIFGRLLMSLASVFLAACVGGEMKSWGCTERDVGQKCAHKTVEMTNVHPRPEGCWRPNTRCGLKN